MLTTTGFGNFFGSEPDWLGQHTAFPEVFRQNFYQTGRLLPNFLFEIGGGQNIFNFSYYGLLSPLFLPSYFLPFVDLITYTSIVGIIQYIVSGILIYIFLKRHYINTDSLFAAILFLSMAPIVVYSRFNIMFVWYMPFLLLSLIGLDRYFDSGKSLLFIISTVCIIMTNFYFSAGSLICLFIYSVYRILNDGPFTWKTFIKSTFSMLLLAIIPILLCGFFLLPTASAILSSIRPYTKSLILKQLILHRAGNIFYEFFSYGITGTMLLALIGNLFTKETKNGDKFLNTVLLVFTVSPLVPYLLNGTLYLNSKSMIPFLPLYIFSFIAFLKNLKDKNIKTELPTLITLLFLLSCFLLHRSQTDRFIMVAIEIIIFILCRKKTALVCIYSVIFLLCGTFNNEIRCASFEFIDNLHIDEINEMMKSSDDEIYRTNISYMDKHLCNRTFGENFLGVSSYSSTPNSSYLDFYENHAGNNESQRISIMLAGAGNEQFYNFMGTKYIFSKTDPGFLYEKVRSGKNINMYENKNAYPLVYKSIKTVSEKDFDKTQFPYNTEILANSTIVKDGNSSPSETSIKRHNVPSEYKFIAKRNITYKLDLDDFFQNKQLYLSFDINNNGKLKNHTPLEITVNGVRNVLNEKDNTYYNENTNFEYIIPLEDTTTLNITVSPGKYDIKNLKMYFSDVSFVNYKQADNLKFNKNDDTITCSVDASGSEYLVTSIPYDKGFSVTLNGKKAKIEKVNKSFIGVKLSEGKNKVVFEYNSPGLRSGFLLSSIGLILFLTTVIKKAIEQKKKAKMI